MGPMYFWLAAFVVFGVVEAATVSLTSIWFAFGALISLIAAALGAEVWLQVTLFILAIPPVPAQYMWTAKPGLPAAAAVRPSLPALWSKSRRWRASN